MQFLHRFELDDVATPGGPADRETASGDSATLWDDDAILDAVMAAQKAAAGAGALSAGRLEAEAALIGRPAGEEAKALR